jgi:hypothetical protein
MLRAIVVLAGFVFTTGAANIDQQVRAEIQRVRDLASSIKTDPRLKEMRSYLDNSLKGVTEDMAAGHVYSTLDKLEQASDLAWGLRAAANDAAVVKGGMPAFEVEWKKASQRVSQIHTLPPGTPAAIRALAETARVKATTLLDSGRGFATSMEPKDGLFHLGEAEGQAEFADFCANLGQGRAGQPPPFRSLAPELQALQEKTNAAFVPPQSIEKHSAFIGLNSAIKLAKELDEAKLYPAALYQYLDAVRQYGTLNAHPPGASAQEALRAKIAAERRRIAGSKRDDSIEDAWLDRAEAALAGAPNEDMWKAAAVLVAQVLPAYDAALGDSYIVQASQVKTVEVTLVRWPYT